MIKLTKYLAVGGGLLGAVCTVAYRLWGGWALLALAMLLSMAACSSGGENTAPEIMGAADQTVVAGSEFNAMEGVTASDVEDGDITAKITITSMPELTFQNGKVTPDKAGSYELTYSVTDKGGLTAVGYATLSVT